MSDKPPHYDGRRKHRRVAQPPPLYDVAIDDEYEVPKLLESDWPGKLTEAAVIDDGETPGSRVIDAPDVERRRYARVVDDKVVEGPVMLHLDPKELYGDSPGEWVEVDEGVQCHHVRKGKKFEAPPPLPQPLVVDPLDQLRALLRDNPTLLDQLVPAKDAKK